MTGMIRQLQVALEERAWTQTRLSMREPTASLSTELLELRPVDGSGATIKVVEDGGSLHVMAGDRTEDLLDNQRAALDLIAAIVEQGLVEDYLLGWFRNGRPASGGEMPRSGWRRRKVWPAH
ncbi:hypothetical protein [Angustibacter luteus]|uniref:YbaB/EbfC family DNA-binding protein n=1 Tax=Angustibacter luteus TaxID=658456 RepID=A0ABW1JE22_9ACTN